MNLYDNKKIDFTKETMFFGEGKNTQRFDVMKYPWFDQSNDKQQGLDWKHDEISMTQDKIDFNTKMTESEKFVYTRVLQKLIFLDSLQGRGPILTFGQIVTLPELENVILTWEYFEGAKHSKTYTHNLRNVYDDPAKIFDEAFDIPELKKVSDKIIEPYNKLYGMVIDYIYYKRHNKNISDKMMLDLRKQIILGLININILEGMRFYSGFSCLWAMTEGQGYIPGTSKNLMLICRDENQHLALTQKWLYILKTNKDEGFVDIYKDLEVEIFNMYKDAYDQEIEWIDYLFSKGSYIGMNAEISKYYMSHITYKRMKAIGLEPFNKDHVKNPLPWVDKYILSDKTEVLAMESEITNYITGGINNNTEIDRAKMKKLIF